MKWGLELKSHSNGLPFNHGGFYLQFSWPQFAYLNFEWEVIEVNTTNDAFSSKIQWFNNTNQCNILHYGAIRGSWHSLYPSSI